MTTHDFSMLERYCDQVVLLTREQILRRGTPLDVLNSEEFAAGIPHGRRRTGMNVWYAFLNALGIRNV